MASALQKGQATSSIGNTLRSGHPKGGKDMKRYSWNLIAFLALVLVFSVVVTQAAATI